MRTVLTIACILVLASLAFGQAPAPTVMRPVQFDVSPPLYTMALANPPGPVTSPRQVLQKHGPLVKGTGNVARAGLVAAPSNTALQATTQNSPAFSAQTGLSFEGLGAGFSGYNIAVAPPDTTMAVSPNYVVQWVNIHYAIWDKAGNPLLPAPYYRAGNLLWSGFGGACQSTNDGDILVQFDHLANRWVFSQFALPNFPNGPFYQCFAISTTDNPMGTYNRYAYQFANMNDYGKLGLWPDAYYMSYNMFSSGALNFMGTEACAYDRAAMVAGSPSPVAVCFGPSGYGNYASYLPSDWDGTTAPAAGSPNIFLGFDYTNDPAVSALSLYKFHVDFVTPGNSTFTNFASLPIPGTRAACNHTGGTCITQPSPGELLDTLGDRMMYRLAYRKIAGVDTLVVNQAVDPDGAGAIGAALRLYEIRSAFTAPALFQNITFQPDSTNRWMGSAAMDKVGNIAVGYSASSAAVFPSIRVTGRLRSEIRNQLQAETSLAIGSGYQTSTSHRWGDYSTLQVDPADGCTFWFTTEYYGASGAFNWRTKVSSFKFPNCQ